MKSTNLRLILVVTLLASGAPTLGQQPADAQPRVEGDSRDIQIADDPRTVDPATLLPAALAAKATVEFDGESLIEVAEWLTRREGLTAVLDKQGLGDRGIPLGEPVYDKLRDEPLYLLLGRLKMLEVGWTIDGDLVTLTSMEQTKAETATRPYNLGWMLDAGYDRDSVLDLIISTVATATWAENGGGEAELRWLGDVLFVNQTAQVQRRLSGLLQALRHHGRRTFIFDPPQHITIREKLGQPVDVRFRQTPLKLALEELSEKSGVDIRLDPIGMSELGVSPRQPVTLELAGQNLRSVLMVMLRDLDMDWMLRDGVLWVTSEDRAESLLKTAVYDVRDLSNDYNEADALTSALSSQVLPESWAMNGGGMCEIRFAKPGVMVVSQSEEGHRQMLGLLASYREALRQSKPRPVERDDPQQVVTRFYRLPRDLAQGVARVMRDLVAPDSWQSDDEPNAVGTWTQVPTTDEVQKLVGQEARVVPHRVLIIRQTRAAHEEIVELIAKVRNGYTGEVPGAGGFGGRGGFGGGYFSVPDR